MKKLILILLLLSSEGWADSCTYKELKSDMGSSDFIGICELTDREVTCFLRGDGISCLPNAKTK